MTDHAAELIRPHWAERHLKHARKDTRSDAEVAGDVRMLCRNDLMHEMIVVRARDRIALLSHLVQSQAAEIAYLRSFIQRLSVVGIKPGPSGLCDCTVQLEVWGGGYESVEDGMQKAQDGLRRMASSKWPDGEEQAITEAPDAK